ncbi:MAG: phenylalanine--tRNA ligase subunit alpha [Parachlamydia sp.]|nr:phenylalanine--tRNA ligase subunit alpha [Parachlamydia sp.]
MNEIESLRHQFHQELAEARNSSDLEALKVRFMGKKGPVQKLMQGLKDVPPEQRPEHGKWINDLKEELSRRISEAHEALILEEEGKRLSKEMLDVTLPGRRGFPGRKHLITQMMDEIIGYLSGMGFSVQLGPDIDSDYYNFEGLNFPPDHPARDMQDTFYLSPTMLLRTQTTNIQLRTMEGHKPPIRIIAPGKAYRNETITARSHVFFHQVDALYIDKGVTFADLLATMREFLSKLFHREVETRFRPSYFPFVEPGMEVDVRCLTCGGGGCMLCKYSGWLEVAGAGMVHPEVLKNGDIDPEIYSGYAWGMGVERIILLRHGVRDIRLFTENDMRFLEQFPAV